MKFVYENYVEQKEKSLGESIEIREHFNWSSVAKIGRDTVIDFLHRKPWLDKPISNNKILISYTDGPKVEIIGNDFQNYKVDFMDNQDRVLYSSNIHNKMWTSCALKYYVPWKIRINGEIHDELNLENKRVLISLESKSVGDTIAWAPYAVAFGMKHKCKVVLSTFHNGWFKGLSSYKDIEFLEPGMTTKCYAVYRIGWFKDEQKGWKRYDLYPNQVNLIPLQKTACDILGLNYQELNLGLNYIPKEKPYKQKYVVIGPQSTAGCKEWTYDNWTTLSKMLNEIGYKVVSLTKDSYHIDNVTNVHNTNWQNVFNILFHSDLFIGLASGLSWVNWALGKQTVMIAGFSEDNHEFTTNLTKISTNVCIKCWNDPVLVFDAGDWNWCPVYKGTERQHICQKSITPISVFNEIQNLI